MAVSSCPRAAEPRLTGERGGPRRVADRCGAAGVGYPRPGAYAILEPGGGRWWWEGQVRSGRCEGGRVAERRAASPAVHRAWRAGVLALGLATGDMGEPHGPRAEDDDETPADPLRVAEALQRLSRMGITKDEAEHAMEAPSERWTLGIMRDLTTWVKERRGAETEGDG